MPVTEFRAAVVVGVRQHLVRDDPLPHRAPAGDDLPAVGVHAGAADRRRRRAALPRRGARRAGQRRPGDRDRRRRRAHLRRDDARLRRRRAACAAGCSRCRCSRRGCRRTGCTSSRRSRRPSRGRSSRGCATRSWCATTRAQRAVPATIRPMDYAAAVRAAVADARERARWRPPGPTPWSSQRRPARPRCSRTQEGMIIERRQRTSRRRRPTVFAVVRGIGGERGYRLRRLDLASCAALLDRLVGGVGLRRGRRDPQRPARRRRPGLLARRGRRAGPAAAPARRDEGPRRGLAAVRDAARATAARCWSRPPTSPRGLAGLAYWYALYPVHSAIFSGMIAALAAEASRPGRSPGGGRLLAARDRSPSPARRARDARRRVPEEERVPHWIIAAARARAPIRSSRSRDFFKSPTWHFITLHVLLLARRHLARRAPTGSSRTRGGASTTRSSSPCACSPASCSGRSASSSTPSCGRRSTSPTAASASSRCR